MKNIKLAVLGIVIVLLFSGSHSQWVLDSFLEGPALLSAPSYIPPEEAYTHIGGGFFSVFESRVGEINRVEGSVIMCLNKLYHSSRFVYQPEGELIFRFSQGVTQSFAMERLDYVELNEEGPPLYRMRLRPGSGCESDIRMAYLICSATAESSPTLIGKFYIMWANAPVEVLDVRIAGRNESRADNHLHKVIAALTEL